MRRLTKLDLRVRRVLARGRLLDAQCDLMRGRGVATVRSVDALARIVRALDALLVGAV